MVDALRDEFAGIRDDSGDQNADIRFRFVDQLPDIGTYLSIPPLKAGDGVYQAEQGGMTYQVRAIKDGFDVLICARHNHSNKRSGALSGLKRFADWNYLSPAETIAKNFLYDIFDHLTQLVHLEQGASYLHASSFEKDGRAVALVAWGGIGKTTSLLKLVSEDNWRFLSDDLGLIDRDGILWRTPKKMQIYAYNIEGQPGLKQRLLGGRTPVDRASWTYRRVKKGPKGVRRRVSGAEFFGPSLAGTPTKLTDLFFIERANVKKFERRSIGVAEIARQSAVILLDELQPFVEHATALHSGDFRPILSRPDVFYQNCFNIMRQAFAGQNPDLIRIPLKAGPDELADFLRKALRD